MDILKFYQNLGYSFTQLDLIEQAMTHRSAVYDGSDRSAHNERLEFLGDSILNFLTTQWLYEKFPEENEGFLTARKNIIVSSKALARTAHQLELYKVLIVGPSEENKRQRTSILADAFEALIAAIQMEFGLDAVRDFLLQHHYPQAESFYQDPDLRNFKSELGELLQGQGLEPPEYRVISETGPPHEMIFEVEVLSDDKVLAQAQGTSKKKAQQIAAQKALNEIKRLN